MIAVKDSTAVSYLIDRHCKIESVSLLRILLII